MFPREFQKKLLAQQNEKLQKKNDQLKLRTFELVLGAMSTNGQWTLVNVTSGSVGLWHVLMTGADASGPNQENKGRGSVGHAC